MANAVRRFVLFLLLVVLSVSVAARAAAAPPSGTLNVAYATLFDENLNPLHGPAPSKVFYDVMYEYLLYNDPQTLKVESGLAERWSMSQDGKRWVFFLRKGVTFSDGTELTAEDVKFSLELLVRKESRWPLREALATKLGDFLTNDMSTIPVVSASYLYGTNPKKVRGWQPTRGKYPDRFEWASPVQ